MTYQKQDFTKKPEKSATMSHLKKQLDLATQRLEEAKKIGDEKAMTKNKEIIKCLSHTLGEKEK